MRLHLAAILAFYEIMVLIQHSQGLLMLPFEHSEPNASSLISRLSSMSIPPSKSFSFSLNAAKKDDRIFKAGGGVSQTPDGEMALFNPGEQGMLGGTSDLVERLKLGISYHQEERGEEQPSEASPSETTTEVNGEVASAPAPEKSSTTGRTVLAQEEATAEVPHSISHLHINGEVASNPAPEELSKTETVQVHETVADAPIGQTAEPAPPAEPKRDTYWPYQPMASSSTSPYQRPAVVRGRRAAAIEKRYLINGIDTATDHRTTTSISQPGAATPPNGRQATPIASAETATPQKAATETGLEQAVAVAAERKMQEERAAINSAFWGKQSNWWDNPGGKPFEPNN